MASLSREQLEKWLKTIEVKGSVLDIGGGQKSLKGRTKSFDPSDYIVMDRDISFTPDVEWDINVPKKFEELFPERKNKFDQIFCIEVSEYFVNPVTCILNMSDWLTEFGEVNVSFHLSYPLHKPDGADMLRYTKNWIEKVFKEYGFKKLDITNRVATEGLDLLRAFNATEKMKSYKDEEVIGYLVRARKR